METGPLPYKKIIFVCTNRRESGPRTCCAHHDGEAIREALKDMVKKRRLRSKIRVSQSGCMDQCEHGPNIMVFPDNMWYSGVTIADLDAILDAIAASLS